MAKSAAQLLYGPLLYNIGTKTAIFADLQIYMSFKAYSTMYMTWNNTYNFA